MITLYCLDTVNDAFYEVSEDIKNIMYNFIEYKEFWREDENKKLEGS